MALPLLDPLLPTLPLLRLCQTRAVTLGTSLFVNTRCKSVWLSRAVFFNRFFPNRSIFCSARGPAKGECCCETTSSKPASTPAVIGRLLRIAQSPAVASASRLCWSITATAASNQSSKVAATALEVGQPSAEHFSAWRISQSADFSASVLSTAEFESAAGWFVKPFGWGSAASTATAVPVQCATECVILTATKLSTAGGSAAKASVQCAVDQTCLATATDCRATASSARRPACAQHEAAAAAIPAASISVISSSAAACQAARKAAASSAATGTAADYQHATASERSSPSGTNDE